MQVLSEANLLTIDVLYILQVPARAASKEALLFAKSNRISAGFSIESVVDSNTRKDSAQ